MPKPKAKLRSMDLKLNLDLNDLKPKYDRISPEIFRALDHVEDVQVRGQLECLLSDVYDTFLQPEVEQQQNTHQPSQFLQIIQKLLRNPATTNKRKVYDAINLKRVNITAIKKLEQAKAIQKQVQDLDSYFESILSSLPCTSPETKTDTGGSHQSPKRRARSAHTCSASTGSRIAEQTNATNRELNKTQHCKNGPDEELKSPDSCRKRPLRVENVTKSKQTSENVSSEISDAVDVTLSHTLGRIDSDRIDSMIFDAKEADKRGRVEESKLSTSKGDSKLTPLEGKLKLPLSTEGGDTRRKSKCTTRRYALSRRSFEQEIAKIKRVTQGMTEFQLNLPKLDQRDSESLVAKTKSAGLSVFHRDADSFDGTSTVELTADGVVSGLLMQSDEWSGKRERGSMAKSSCSGHLLCGLSGHESYEGSQRDAKRSSQSGDSSARNVTSTFAKIEDLVDNLKSVGLSMRHRKKRVDSLKKSNIILSEQISEVEGTLQSFDNYLNAVKSKASPVAPDVIRREMYAFQEVMMEKIFSCIEVLSLQMDSLRQTERIKATKTEAMLARYEAAKRENPETLVFLGCSDSTLGAQVKMHNNELARGLRAVVTGIEYFHASCEDIWDETISGIFSELETLLMSMPSPPAKPWSPDSPNWSPSLSLSTAGALGQEMERVQKFPEDKSQYGAAVVFSLKMLERVSSDLSHIMVVTRIRDLQMISIDHSIGLAFISIKQMMGPAIVKSPNAEQGKATKRKKSLRPALNEKKKALAPSSRAKKTKITTEKPDEMKLRPQDLAAHEKDLQNRLNTNINVDKRMLKFRAFDGKEPRDEATEARHANRGLLSNQLQACNAHHMGAAADMKLPLLQSRESFGISDAPNHSVSTSGGNSVLSPWFRQRKDTQKSRKTVAQSPSPAALANMNASGLKKNLPKLSGPSQGKKTLPKSAPVESSKDSNPVIPPAFIQGTVTLLNEEGQPVDCMGNALECGLHRPIQYCRILAMPTPPPASFSSDPKPAKPDLQKSVVNKVLRKPPCRTALVKQGNAQEASK